MLIQKRVWPHFLEYAEEQRSVSAEREKEEAQMMNKVDLHMGE